MGYLFILFWTENAPPLSVQIKIKRYLTVGKVSFYLNLDRHQDLAQSRVYQCAKTSKSRNLKPYFCKGIFYRTKTISFKNFLQFFKEFPQKNWILLMGHWRGDCKFCIFNMKKFIPVRYVRPN